MIRGGLLDLRGGGGGQLPKKIVQGKLVEIMQKCDHQEQIPALAKQNLAAPKLPKTKIL